MFVRLRQLKNDYYQSVEATIEILFSEAVVYIFQTINVRKEIQVKDTQY